MSDADRREHPIEAISAFIDGELRGSERAAVEAHLAGCESCRRLAEDLRRIALAVPDAARVEVPANLEARIKSRLRDESKAPRRRFVLPTAIAATVGALALLGTHTLRQSKPLGEPARSSVESPRGSLGGSVVDEVTAGKKQSEEGANPVREKSNHATGSGERKDVSFRDQETLQKAEARDSKANDLPNEPAPPAAPPPAAASKPARRDEQSAPQSAERAERQDADQRFAPSPPPPPAASPDSLQLERARIASPEDARKAKEKSSAAESEADFPPGGVVGGVVGGVSAARADNVAPQCPSPWRAPVEVSWDAARSGDPQSVLATVARDHAGQIISGRDEKGPFVSLLLPAAAWPGILESLRVLGAVVPSAPPPSLPAGTLCVRLDVRVSESVTR